MHNGNVVINNDLKFQGVTETVGTAFKYINIIQDIWCSILFTGEQATKLDNLTSSLIFLIDRKESMG